VSLFPSTFNNWNSTVRKSCPFFPKKRCFKQNKNAITIKEKSGLHQNAKLLPIKRHHEKSR